MKRDKLLLGGPGLNGYTYAGDVYCIDCGQDIIWKLPDELDARDRYKVPLPIFFGESNVREHCATCGKYLYGGDSDDPDAPVTAGESRSATGADGGTSIEYWHNTPTARRILAALRNTRAFGAFLRWVLPDDTVFSYGSPAECPVALYLYACMGLRIDVYGHLAGWQEGDVPNACVLPPMMQRFVRAYYDGSYRTVTAVRKLWWALTVTGE
jgi:hypothetical protein